MEYKITIVILGSVCGLKNISQIYQWVENEAAEQLLEELEIKGCVVVADVLNCQMYTLKKTTAEGLNIVIRYKEKSKSKLAFSKIMLDFSLDSSRLLEVVCKN